MNLDLLLEAVHFVEQNPDHDYCNAEKSRMRGHHNELERKRRADLRDTLEELKKVVPADDKRLSTVRLLNEAAAYVSRLKKRHKTVDFETQKLDIEMECLRDEISKYSSIEQRINSWISGGQRSVNP